MNIRCAKDIYDYYKVDGDKSRLSANIVKKAIVSISKDKELKYYANKLWCYLYENKISIYDFVYYDRFMDMLKYSNLNNTTDIRVCFRKILRILCCEHRVLKLSLELCIIPDIKDKYSYYDLCGLDKGLSEAYLGIYPYDLLPHMMKNTILINLKMSFELVSMIKKFLRYYRTHDIRKRRIETNTLTLLKYCHVIRRLCVDSDIKSWKEFDGYEGALKIKNYLERKRVRNAKQKCIEYQLKLDNNYITSLNIYFGTMWKEMGLKQNPFDVKDPLDPSPEGKKRAILESISLPSDRSEFHNTKIVHNQVKIKVTTEDGNDLFVSPCFEEKEYASICSYINERSKNIMRNETPKIDYLSLEELSEYLFAVQGDFLLAFAILNGARPVDYFAMNVENIGKFSTDIMSPTNRRFFCTIVPVENNVKLSPNKIRPEKRMFGNLFTLFCHYYKVRQGFLKLSKKTIKQDRYSNMIEKGTPLFISRFYKRACMGALTKQFRCALRRVGLGNKSEKITLYWCRKSFITYNRKFGLSLEHISKITGTDPKTLYSYYVQLDMLQDTNEQYANCFLVNMGMKPQELNYESRKTGTNLIAKYPNVSNDATTNLRYEISKISEDDKCSLKEAIQITELSKSKLSSALFAGYIQCEKINKHLIFSVKKLKVFKDKYSYQGDYIDAKVLAKMISAKKRKRITVRRVLQLMSTTLRDSTIRIGNKFYTELNAALKLAQERRDS